MPWNAVWSGPRQCSVSADGGSISSQSVNVCDQNVVYQAALSASRVPYRSRSQSRKAARAQVAVAGAAVLVADVPGDDRRVRRRTARRSGRASSAESRRNTGELGQELCRCPYRCRRPSKSVRVTSGCARASHGGCAPVPVARQMRRPSRAGPLDDPVQRREVVDVRGGLGQRPGEDAERDGVDAGGVEQPVVLASTPPAATARGCSRRRTATFEVAGSSSAGSLRSPGVTRHEGAVLPARSLRSLMR